MVCVKGRRLRCTACQLARINGVVCHEAGCPDEWHRVKIECKWCGRPFYPRDKDVSRHGCCSASCLRAYRG